MKFKRFIPTEGDKRLFSSAWFWDVYILGANPDMPNGLIFRL